MAEPPFVTRLTLENYKSIAQCDVRLGPLTFLIGPNGSGKSNFVDALRFVADAVRYSLDQALRDRNGIQSVVHRAANRASHMTLGVDFTLSFGRPGSYSLRLGVLRSGGYEVQLEECRLAPQEQYHIEGPRFSVRDGVVDTNVPDAFPGLKVVAKDKLLLGVLSAFDTEFRPVSDLLASSIVYNVIPAHMRPPQPSQEAQLLLGDGSNVAAVLRRIANRDDNAWQRIVDYLKVVVPEVTSVEVESIGQYDTFALEQATADGKATQHFQAASLSDGTLRALAILVALFQGPADDGHAASLVGIEEPEAALHPLAVRALLDALRDASRTTQIVVTSHSPDLLDDADLTPDAIRVVVHDPGGTRIGPLGKADRAIIGDQTYTIGELMRRTPLRPGRSSGDSRLGASPA